MAKQVRTWVNSFAGIIWADTHNMPTRLNVWLRMVVIYSSIKTKKIAVTPTDYYGMLNLLYYMDWRSLTGGKLF